MAHASFQKNAALYRKSAKAPRAARVTFGPEYVSIDRR